MATHPAVPPKDKTLHRIDDKELEKKLQTSFTQGLHDHTAKERIEKYGLNELEEDEKESFWDKIKEQFEDRMVRLLLLAAVVSFVVSLTSHDEHDTVPPWVEPTVIISILILNGCIGIYQDYNAEKATEALKKLQSDTATVIREGGRKIIKSADLVPGDIINVKMGDKVPADARIIRMNTLSMAINQSSLTGENKDVSKDAGKVNSDDIIGQTNMVFSGSLCTNGDADCVVCYTGMQTQIGEIQKEVKDAEKDTEDDKTPLGKKLDNFGHMLEKSIFYVCIGIWVINIRNFSDPMLGGIIKGALYYFKIAVALAVAAIPEGLPAVITTCLALGTRRMTQNNAIIKKLPSVETLGCTTVICSDKTGTLTLNQMVATEFLVFGSNATDLIVSEVETNSYNPNCKILNDSVTKVESNKNITELIDSMILSSTCTIEKDGEFYRPIGTATEGALVCLASKFGQYYGQPNDTFANHIRDGWVIKNVLAFDSKRKTMSVLARRNGTSENVMFAKGAPERIVQSSKFVIGSDGKEHALTEDQRSFLHHQVTKIASKGLRVLAIAKKTDIGNLKTFNGIDDKKHPAAETMKDPENYPELEKDLSLLGFVGIKDPVRKEVPRSIALCKQAGIVVFMVTGDIKETAVSIGQEIGLITEHDVKKYCLTGTEFEAIPDEEIKKTLKAAVDHQKGMIFSRTAPKHKRRLVKLLKEVGQIVAMTGDGVNDAPALQQADIGIAMGITGTEVAKNNASMILADDNFATIVKAVEEGRGIYENMKAFIRYMISSNIGEVVSIFLSSVLGLPDGFNSIQLLWVNLVTDGLPAMALSFNPPDSDIMIRPPRDQSDGIVDAFMVIRYFSTGVYVGLGTVGIFIYWYLFYDWAADKHPLITFNQLSNWAECPDWKGFKLRNFDEYRLHQDPCSYFTAGKARASTLSLSVLVMIEMFNAFNALSENQSILKTGLFINPILILAVCSSIALHCVILYVPYFNFLFGTAPLSLGVISLLPLGLGTRHPLLFPCDHP
jgi:Ca2+-transporting ATPase